MSQSTKNLKRPESVLVLVYALTGRVLLLRRSDHPNFWQSVTGSLSWEESDPRHAALRELREETGLDGQDLKETGVVNRYPILPEWRQRYAPDVKENTEYVYFLALPTESVITLNASEHREYGWYSFEEAALKVFSWTNREAILKAKGQL